MARVPAPHRIGDPPTKGEFLPGTLDEHLAGPLSRFLEEAEPVLFSPGTTPDPFSDAPGMRARVGVMTDGTWVWQLAWSDHVAFHARYSTQERLERLAPTDRIYAVARGHRLLVSPHTSR
ncbi:hypothetical protein ACFU5N_04900 [Streptomyces albidoflavus]